MNAQENFYDTQDEPIKGCLLALRSIILQKDINVTAAWKYGMPFFCYQGKMFCYLWVHKKYQQPYLGLVEGKHFDEPFLLQEDRSRMKIMLFDPADDLPVEQINSILEKAIGLYK